MRLRFVPALLLALLLGACSDPGTSSSSVPTGTMTRGATAAGSNTQPAPIVVDVRTPAEFEQGHLAGAVNLDVNANDFAQSLEGLDKAARYVVYCRSGNRSAQAARAMAAAGFQDVDDAGSITEASAATGLTVVTD